MHPPNDQSNVNTQAVDFVFNAAARWIRTSGGRKRTQKKGKWTETVEQWTRGQLEACMNACFSRKESLYKDVVLVPARPKNTLPEDAAPDAPKLITTSLAFSTRGTPHSTALAWLKSLPVDIMKAVRRAMSFKMQLILNQGVDRGLKQGW